MQAPCQKIVWDVLPAIRAAIAVELVKYEVSQIEASKMLEIAPLSCIPVPLREARLSH